MKACLPKLSPYFFLGTLCQEIILGPSRLITPCTSKSRSGLDQFVFNGTIGRDIPDLISKGWQTNMIVQAYHPGVEDSSRFCVTELKGDTCDTGAGTSCSCVYKMKQIHFVVNYTLDKFYSQAVFVVVWSHDILEDHRVVSDKNYSLPEICDVTTARLTLTIAGVVGSLPTNGSCSFTLALSTFNPMELCCSDMAMPCYTQISFRGTVVATNESPCVIYSPTADGVTDTLQLSYSVCTMTEYTQGSDCTIRKGVVTTSATTQTSQTTDVDTTESIGTTTEQPSSPMSSTLQIVLGTVLLVIICAIIISGSVALCVILKRRKAQATASEPLDEPKRESIPESLPQESEVEQHVELRETGSNESTASPSEIERVEV